MDSVIEQNPVVAKPSITTRTTCRLCDSRNIAPATKFADMPRADGYTRAPVEQAIYPCELWACQDCGHAQIVNIVNPDALFRQYLYRSGDFPYVVEAFAKFAHETCDRFQPKRVFEIGSNDGTMLGFFKDRGAKVTGIDPSDVQSPHGVIHEYFSSKLATNIAYSDNDALADVLIAFNSFAHCDDLYDYVEGVRTLLAPNGVFIFEASYLSDIVPGQFDKFDHEHLSYHSVGPLVPFFQAHGLELFDVTRNPSKGGSIRGYVQHKGGKRPVTSAVHIMPVREEQEGFRSLRPYHAMQSEIARLTDKIHRFMEEHPGAYAGFGASSSSTPLIYDLELQTKLCFLVDDNPSRHGLYSPAAKFPVRDPKMMEHADYVLMLAWRYADRIMAKHDVGGKWVKVI